MDFSKNQTILVSSSKKMFGKWLAELTWKKNKAKIIGSGVELPEVSR